jgi:diketogulonate reductase-like aldo/keto reductase
MPGLTRHAHICFAGGIPPLPPGPQGCWQLSGGHKGESKSDRTSGQAAVEDFAAYVAAGVTSFDTADIYGPSESLIGHYLKHHPAEKPHVQVLTKFCCFGDMMRQAKELRYVEQVCVLVGVWRGGVRGLQRLVPCSVG